MPKWKDPAILGPVAAALIAAAVSIGVFILELDRSPPGKPVIEDIYPLPDAENRFVVQYAGAHDADDGSGLREVRLWHRHSTQTDWVQTNWVSTAPEGRIVFVEPEMSGEYYFDLVSVDQSGNESSHPFETGQASYFFVDREVMLADNSPDPATESADPATESSDPAIELDHEVRISNTDPVNQSIEIPVYFHIITSDGHPVFDERVIGNQLNVLNAAFFDGDISFSLAGLDSTENAEWDNLSPGSEAQLDMMTRLAVSPESQLNVYVVNSEGGILSWSTFPWAIGDEPELDGCIIHNSTLPGGSPPFDEGKTLVHCVGHWLGLYHTFQDGCSPLNDYVEDTPAHFQPNYGTPEEAVACQEGEEAPVHNYMNYTDDNWQWDFTSGQFARMRRVIGAFRSSLL